MTAISKILYRGPSLTKAKKALILLHGRGGNADDILSISNALCGPDVYIAAPEATNNSWYPLSFMQEESLNEPNLSESITAIKALIDETAKVISEDNIFLAGFSQGACLSLEISSRYARTYGGVIAFTGGLLGKTIDKSKYHGNFEGTPVFMSNGDHDPFIPLTRSEESKKFMETLGAKVTLHVYEGRPHTISQDELQYVRENFFNNLECEDSSSLW